MLTTAQLQTVHSVFNHVHSMFEYISDDSWYGQPERWEDPEYIRNQLEAGLIKGDCDNFALACRYLLNVSGIPNRVVFCVTETGEGHLVCEAEGWILDNRQQEVKAWKDLPYTWVKISGYKPGDPWHEVTTS